MTDQISFLPMLDDADHPTWLLSGRPGIKNDCVVYTENVMEFREGRRPMFAATDSFYGGMKWE